MHSITGNAQVDSSVQKVNSILGRLSDRMLKTTERTYAGLEKKLTDYSRHSLKRIQRQEKKLQRKLSEKDSFAVKDAPRIQEKYALLEQQLKHPEGKTNNASLNNYLPGLDSVQTMFSFLNKNGARIPGISADKLQQVNAISLQLKNLQSQWQQADAIKQFIKERKQQLKEELDRFAMGGQMKDINKEVYYYQQQLNEYKSMLNDPDKLQQQILGLARNLPAFKDFMSHNGLLAQLFGMPAGLGTAQALNGLQTSTGLQQQLTQQLGTGASPQQYLQQQVQQAQAELNKLKDKISQAGGSNSDMVIPDFKPNGQKTKTFWKRIEYGMNIQSQKTNAWLPTTTDIALTAGYKLNDNSTIGIGLGYKMGWGKDISHIRISNEGVGLRSFVDVKLKGSIWISGGYEYNYQQSFTKIDQLKDLAAWQKSGLIGLTKKYKIGKKNGNLQLLWDFLSYSQVPQTPALKFRVGYSF